MITRCLSKLQGSALRTLLTSEALSKMNRTLWSPRLKTLNPLWNHHNGVKVLTIASMLRARFVRNFATIICSRELRSLSKQQLGPSLSESIRVYWMMIGRGRKKKKLFPNTLEKNPTSQWINIVDTWKTTSLCNEGTTILLPRRSQRTLLATKKLSLLTGLRKKLSSLPNLIILTNLINKGLNVQSIA